MESLITNQLSILIIYALNFLLLCVNLGYLIRLYSQNRKSERRLKEIDKKADQIKEKADEQVREVLDKAIQRARRTLLESKYLKQDLINDLEESIRQVVTREINILDGESKDFNKDYKQLFEKVRGEYNKKADETLASIEHVASAEIEHLEQSLEHKALESQEALEKDVKQELEKAKKIVESYKEHRMAQVDESVNKIILQVSEEVLGKSISSNQHQEIVMEALEKAKRDNLF